MLSLAVLAGCDPIYGVGRRADVAFMPPPAQVQALLQSVPGVRAVEYEVREGSRPLTARGVQPPDTVYSFIYHGDADLWGELQFLVDYRHRVHYSQHFTWMGSRPPQRAVDAVLPVMREIEVRLETRAGLAGLRDSVKQSCWGVRCS